MSSGVSHAIVDGEEADRIQPVSINHAVEEIWTDERRKTLDQRYNYLDYHFEQDGRYCRARVYFDDPRTVFRVPLDEDRKRRIFRDNARALYGLD